MLYFTPFSDGPNDAIFTKFGTVVDLTYVMTYAHFGCYRLKGGHAAAVQSLPFSHDFNGWPYNRQALTCCRDPKLLAAPPRGYNAMTSFPTNGKT